MIDSSYGVYYRRNGGNIMKNWADILKNLTILTAVRPFFYYPLLLCLALSWWLTEKFNLGSWVYIPGFFFGLGGSAMVATNFISPSPAIRRRNGKRPNSIFLLTIIIKRREWVYDLFKDLAPAIKKETKRVGTFHFSVSSSWIVFVFSTHAGRKKSPLTTR